MRHLLICGSAGFTNIGDDAILWGMLTQLRRVVGERAIRVVGGPELERVTAPFGADAMSYDDRAELARAIEDADLVVLGGGGMLYDFGYDASLERLLADRPDRQWLYELARIAVAARASDRPAMLYGVGVGPLHTQTARRLARFTAEQVQVVTVRDGASADLLVECGLPRTRVHVAADPAVAVEAESSETADAFLDEAGIAGAPRPWVALNLRGWYRFGAADSAQEQRGDALDRLVEEAAALAGRVQERLGGTVVLLPLQHLYDDDRVILRRVAEAYKGHAVPKLVEPQLCPPALVAALAQFDLVVGMRLHALVLALDAGVPFVALSYERKVEEFARAAGVAEHLHPVGGVTADAVLASCEALLSEREAVQARLAEARARAREAAQIPAELAAALLEGTRAAERLAAPRHSRLTPDRKIRVLMQTRPDYRERPGGDVVQLEEVQRYLADTGLRVDLRGEEAPDLSEYDLVHTINLDRPDDAYRHCLNAVQQGKPVVVSPVHTDMSEFLEWADTDYWELPEPAEGVPQPRRAPLPDPSERRRRAGLHLQRQLVVDWATAYLPNAQMDADYLQAAFGADPGRTVVVPHGIDPMFFEARPEPFVEKYGLRDFVISAGRVEKRKNQLALIAAMRGTGIPLVIVGQPNPEGYRDLCRRYADGNVLFLDAMSQRELSSAYAAAKVHALVSWFEIPGLVSLEAGAAGCNVVSTDRGSPREYLGDMAWYCEPGSIESINQAVLAAYEAPRSDRLREHIREHYTWRKAGERTLEGYRLALSLHEDRPERDKQEAMVEAMRRHTDWLARVAADREYEARQAQRWARDAERRVRGLEATEKELWRLQEEFDRVTSRRLYRWSQALARAAWGILRALGVKR